MLRVPVSEVAVTFVLPPPVATVERRMRAFTVLALEVLEIAPLKSYMLAALILSRSVVDTALVPPAVVSVPLFLSAAGAEEAVLKRF